MIDPSPEAAVVDSAKENRNQSSPALRERLEQVLAAERQRALRCLLMHPMLTAEGDYADDFALVRRHATWLRDWFARNPEWSLHVDSEIARLQKAPADLRDDTRAAVDGRNSMPFTRRRYVFLCLALAVLEQDDRQTTLSRIADAVIQFVAVDPEFKSAGIVCDMTGIDQRRDLVQAVRFLLQLGILRQVHGDEELYLNRKGDVLYGINRPALARVLCVRKGPSMASAASLEDRLDEIAEIPMPDTLDGFNRWISSRLFRRLLDDPVVYYSDLSEKEVIYLSGQRGRILNRIEQATGLAPEVRAEGIALVDSRGDLTDGTMAEEGTDAHVTLLLAEILAQCLRNNPGAVVGEAALRQHVAELVTEHRRHWRKDVSLPGGDAILAAQTVDRLAALRLLRRVAGGVIPLPAIARYAEAVDSTVDNVESDDQLQLWDGRPS